MSYPNFGLLRLLLALEVMLLHYANYEGYSWHKPGTVWYINAVPAFVAISGFLVLRSFEQSGSRREFWWKRLCRIGPAFLLSLILVAAVRGSSMVPGTLLGYLTAGFYSVRNGNPVLWSLMVEEILYGFLAIGVGLGIYKAKWPIWIWIVVGAVVVPFLLADAPQTVTRLGWIFASFPIGSLMYIYREQLGRIPPWYWVALLVFCLLVQFPHTNRYAMHLWTMASAIAVVGVGAWGPALMNLKFDISYGIYIFHIPLYIFSHKQGWPLYAAIMIAVAFSAASWFFIERPALSYKNWFWRRRAQQKASSNPNTFISALRSSEE